MIQVTKTYMNIKLIKYKVPRGPQRWHNTLAVRKTLSVPLPHLLQLQHQALQTALKNRRWKTSPDAVGGRGRLAQLSPLPPRQGNTHTCAQRRPVSQSQEPDPSPGSRGEGGLNLPSLCGGSELRGFSEALLPPASLPAL